MNLNDALTQIAAYAHLDADALIAFAAEDNIGGRNAGYDAWSIDADEGKVLYALVRALHPRQVIEVGVRMGASTEHLLNAIYENNGKDHVPGKLYSYDIEPCDRTGLPKSRWEFFRGDALTADFPPAEFVFEDSNHGLDYSLKLFERLKTFAHVLVTHDYAMTTAHGNFHVKEAFDAVFHDGIAFTLDGCERGMALWANPAWQEAPIPAPRVVEKPTPKPRTKRAPAKRTTKR